MFCFKDQTFCIVADICINRYNCHRWLSPELEKQADIWAKDLPHTPIAYSDFSETCPKWKEEK